MNETKKDSSLPEGWKWVKLVELAKFIDYRGKTPNKTTSGVPLITAKNVKMGYINEEPREYIAEENYKKWMTRGFPKIGDILFTTEAPLGNVAQLKTNSRIALAQRMITFQTFDLIENSFLKYGLMSPQFQELLNKKGTGTTVKGIKAAVLKQLEIPLPPKAIQQAIISKIEELFSELDKSIETLRLAQQQLKTYRQAVLKWAFEGKLTEEWRKENGTSVRVPAGSQKVQMIPSGFGLGNLVAETQPDYQVVNSNSELPERWRWKLINEIGKIRGGKRLPPKHQYSEVPTDYVYIMAGNLKEGTVTNKPTYIKEDTYSALLNYKVSGGEVYITIVGACIGDAGIIPEKISKSILTENAAKIIELKEVFNKYLALWINSAICQENIKSKILSATLGKLALNRIGMLDVPIPLIDEQHQIVSEIESRLSVADKMEESIIQSLQQAEALRQSILKKAFEGNLLL